MGEVIAQADATVNVMFPTGHAVGMTTVDGVELLIHVGIDTVNLEEKHYKAFVEQGQEVKKGDKLIEFDIQAIKEAGYEISTPILVTNTDQYEAVEAVKTSGNIQRDDSLIQVK